LILEKGIETCPFIVVNRMTLWANQLSCSGGNFSRGKDSENVKFIF
jgi:hypothetical protein